MYYRITSNWSKTQPRSSRQEKRHSRALQRAQKYYPVGRQYRMKGDADTWTIVRYVTNIADLTWMQELPEVVVIDNGAVQLSVHYSELMEIK